MRLALLVSTLSSCYVLSSAWSPQFIDGIDKSYTCSCAIRDLPETQAAREESETTIGEEASTPTSTEAPASSEQTDFVPKRYWKLYKGQLQRSDNREVLETSFLDRVLGVFRGRKQRGVFQPQNDATAAFTGLGKRIVNKYIDKLRNDWNLLDRFACHCEGEFMDVLKARNYLTLTIVHD